MKNLCNQRGATLVSVMVGVALGSIASFFLGKMLIYNIRSARNTSLKNETLEFKRNLEVIHDCGQTLASMPADCSTPATIDVYDRSGHVLISQNGYTKVTPSFSALATCLEDHVDATGTIDFPGRYIKISMVSLKPGVSTINPTDNDLEKDPLTGLPLKVEDLYQGIPFSCMYGQRNPKAIASPTPIPMGSGEDATSPIDRNSEN